MDDVMQWMEFATIEEDVGGYRNLWSRHAREWLLGVATPQRGCLISE